MSRLIIFLFLLAPIILYIVNREPDQTGQIEKPELSLKQASAEGHVEAVIKPPKQAPALDLAKPSQESALRKSSVSKVLLAEQERIATEGYGHFPPIDLSKMNKHKRHVVGALEDPQNNSGTLSVTGKREPFDAERYSSDPDYYLNTVEPGRAFDTAQAAEGVRALTRVGQNYYETVQNKSVTLEAKGEAGMPISYTAFDGGHFQNGLNFITLKANGSGIASAIFTPTSGVINQCRIRAASPVNTGALNWVVYTRLATENLK